MSASNRHTINADDSVDFPSPGKVRESPVQEDGRHWYPPGPIAKAFFKSVAFIVGLMGPFGSGKSVTCTIKLIKNMQAQVRGPDGWKRRRTAIIRNTYPELRTTTMNTWFAWVPKHTGAWRDAGPPMMRIVDQKEKYEWEIYFVALDRPDDLKKLLGMELSDAWINEAREVPQAVVDGLTGRVGRYPAIWQGGCTNAQIIMDTNPPDTDHWWYVLAEQDTTNEKNRQIIMSMKEAEELLRVKGFLGKDQALFEFYRQPSGRSQSAENLRNLRPGYYEFQMAGKDEDWTKVYVDGDYGYVREGMPMHPHYKDSTHARDFDIIRGIGLRLGFDFGLTPAATISQRTANGRWRVQDECVSERMGITTFADELMRLLTEKYPGMKIISARGDPAGDAVNPDEQTCFQILQSRGFTIAERAPTNDPTRRNEALSYLLRNNIDGEPAILINKRAGTLRKGLAGGYHRRRLQIAGETRYRDVPEKNKYSHVCEALEYDCVSAGEDRNVTVVPQNLRGHRSAVAESDYDPFNT